MDNKAYEKIMRMAGAVLAVGAVAVLGLLFTDTGSEWYRALAKPSFQPPGPVFPIVWTALYVLIALSLVRLINLGGPDKKGIVLYTLNGLLNILWSFVFFQMQSTVLALVVLLALAVETVLLLRAVWDKDALAGWFLVPYLVWLAFAAILNYVIIMMN